ncbi:MAG: hypothetical protein ACP5OH_04410 [Nitrososphaerota archaeon]
MSVDNRRTQRKKRERSDRYRKGVQRLASKRFSTHEYEDPEIQAEIDKGNTVNFSTCIYTMLVRYLYCLSTRLILACGLKNYGNTKNNMQNSNTR